MNFISSEFALLLAITVALCAIARGRAVTYVLLAASVIFYGWWNPPYLLLLFAVIVISWAGGLVIERWRTLPVLWTVVLGELALLVYFKYVGFLFRNAAAIATATGHPLSVQPPSILLPAGISFMTFQGLAYAVDVYRGELPAERSFVSVALFKSFFPQLVAGPIERASHLMPQLKRLERDGLAHADFARGAFMILKGVALKFVIADNMATIVDAVYGHIAASSPFDVTAAVLAFSVQIYCDFYGYTMIALGSARLFGVELVQNFEHPYLATSIQEFWRRWHISLSRWFRDYVYIPLGGSRVSRVRHAANLLIVMVAVGLWHGASWTFVIWGALHGLMLAVHAGWRRLRPRRDDEGTIPGRIVGWAVTFVAVTLAWIPFRSPDLQTPVAVLGKIAAFAAAPSHIVSAFYGGTFYLTLVAVFVLFELIDANLDLETVFANLPSPAQGVVAVVLMLATYLGPAKDVAFLYFQF